MIKPRKLQPGDTVAVVSLSWGGPGTFPHRYQAGKQQLETEFGVNVVEMPHALADPGWVARNPQARAADLMAAFADPSIKAIISSIGGEDSIRTLPFIDLDVIRANPKDFHGLFGHDDHPFRLFQGRRESPFMGRRSWLVLAKMAGCSPTWSIRCAVHSFPASRSARFSPIMTAGQLSISIGATPANQSRKRALQPCTGWRWLQGSGVHRGHLIGGCIEVLDWLRGTNTGPP